MAENITKLPVKIEKTTTPTPQAWQPFESLRREIDRMFDDFGGGLWRSPFRGSFFEPFRRAEVAFAALPAVDVIETDKAYEITAELPGIDEKNVDVKFANGVLTIKGEKQEEREEKKKGYHMRERSLGSFERTFQVPEGIDADKIKANFKKDRVVVTLPKTAEARKARRKIAIKPG